MKSLFLLLLSIFLMGTPAFGVELKDARTTIVFDGRFNSLTIPDGTYQAHISIYPKADKAAITWEDTVTLNVHQRHFSLILGAKKPLIPTSGSVLAANPFNIPSPSMGISISGVGLEEFPFAAIPFAVYSRVADKALSGRAENVTGNFVTLTTTSNAGLVVDTRLLVANAQRQNVGIGTSQPTAALDLVGTLNATTLHRGGLPFKDTLKWKRSGDDVHYTGGNVGIGIQSLFSTLSVYDGRGTTSENINAFELYMNGRPLSSALDWKRSEVAEKDIYFTNDGGNVGLSTVAPLERLDVQGGIQLGETVYGVDDPISPGTIYWDGSNIYGFDGNTFKFITGIDGTGVENRVGYWRNRNEINDDSHFVFNPITNQLQLGANASNTAYVHLQPLITPEKGLARFRTSTDGMVFLVSAAGDIGIGITPNYDVDVAGTLNSDALLVDGDSFQDRFSRSTYWSRSGGTHIYYLAGYVGIGAPTPNGTYLRIGQPIDNSDIPPVITFRNIKTGPDSVYTLGVDTIRTNTFRVVAGDDISTGAPLFTAYDANMGIGTDTPMMNLSVSGNNGVVLSGPFSDFTGTFTNHSLPTINMGSNLLWYSEKAAFRAGLVDTSGRFSGKEWDFEQLGLYSIGLGHNIAVPQPASSALGGFNHFVDGAYAAVIGGSNNQVSQNFSLAIGTRANAMHFSSFVFRNGSDIGSGFSSRYSNQFVISSLQGVGINTAETLDGPLTVQAYAPTHNFARFVGSDQAGPAYVLITPSQNLLLAQNASSQSDTNTRLSILNGGISFGKTSTLNTSFYAQNYDGVTISFVLESTTGLTTPNLIIHNTGQVGFGQVPSTDPGLYIPSGSITAESYKLPSGEEIKDNDVVIVFSSVGSTPNVYFPSGNYHLAKGTVVLNDEGDVIDYAPTPGYVGIGNTMPRALLNMSKSVLNNALPVIVFEEYDVASFSIGLDTSAPKTLKWGPRPSSTISPHFAVSSQNIGIGISNPQTLFDVASANFRHFVKVATDNFLIAGTTVTANLSVPTLNTKELYYKGSFISESGTPWTPSRVDTSIFKRSGDVAIGTKNSTTYPRISRSSEGVYTTTTDNITLRVSDVISANAAVINGYLNIPSINLRSVLMPYDGDWYTLFMRSGKIFLSPPNTTESLSTLNAQAVSDILTQGSSPDGGVLGFWVTQEGIPNTHLSESIFNWDVENATVSYNGLFNLNQVHSASNSFSATHSISTSPFPSEKGFSVTSKIDAQSLADTNSYTLITLNATLAQWPESDGDWTTLPDDPLDIIGTNIDLNSSRNTTLSLRTSLIGLLVDLNDINVQTNANEGFKYTGLFDGNVGIGTQSPKAALDVAGIVSANSFIISEGLELTTLNVSERVVDGVPVSALFVAANKTVGIQTQSPRAKFEVASGEALFESLIARGFTARSLTVQSKALNVGTNVGIGTSQPTARLHLLRSLQDDSLDEFVFKRLVQVVSANAAAVNADLVGTEINLITSQNNFLGHIFDTTPHTGTGLKIDLTNLSGKEGSVIQGVSVKTGAGSTKNAALFIGGNVAINTDPPSPTANLKISGTLLANNFPQVDFLSEQDQASFNMLVVTDNASFGDANAASLFADTITLLNLNILDPLVLDGFINAGVTVDIRNALVVEQGVIISTNVKSNTTIISDTTLAATASATALRLGTPSFNGALAINGGMQTDTAVVQSLLTSSTLSKTGNQFVMFRTVDILPYLIGLGQATPRYPVDVLLGSSPEYAADLNTSWGQLSFTSADDDQVGIAFTTSASSDNDSPSGLVSRKSGTGAYSLVFITDPQGASLPQERITITPSGNVGIGVSDPVQQLSVSGDVSIADTLRVSGITTNYVTDISQLVLNASHIAVNATFNALSNMALNDLISLQKQPTPDFVSDSGVLYTNQSDVLIFRTQLADNSIITANLSVTFSLESPIVPFYNDDHQVSDQSKMYWIADSDISRFRVGTHNYLTSFAHVTSVNNSLKTSHDFSRISLGFPFRNLTSIDIGDTVFSGLKLSLLPGDNDLDDEDVFLGVQVDVSELAALSFNQSSGASQLGFKHAAIFDGGSVGIGPANRFAQSTLADNLSTDASLHLIAVSDNAVLMVGNDTPYLTVSSQNNVVIGPMQANAARLHVKVTGNAQTDLVFIGQETNTFLRMGHSGRLELGSTLNAELDVGLSVPGTIAAPALTAQNLIATTIQHPKLAHSGSFFGLGTATAIRPFSSQQQFSTHNIPARFGIIDVSLTDTIQQDITGISTLIKSQADGNQINNTATGFTINLTGLKSDTATTVTGLRVHMTDSDTPTSHNAAILQGGKVGIGISQPAYSLDVSGNFKINGGLIVNDTAFTFEGFELLTLESLKSDAGLTVNARLYVDGDVSANIVTATNLDLRNALDITELTTLGSTFTRSITANITTITANTVSSTGRVSANRLILSNSLNDAVSNTLFSNTGLYMASVNVSSMTVTSSMDLFTVQTGTSLISGNVGLGTTLPDSRFHIRAASSTAFSANTPSTYGFAYLSNASNTLGTAAFLRFTPSDSVTEGISLGSIGYTTTSDIRLFSSRNSGTPALDVVITSLGNVGIGNTTPTHSLSVSGKGHVAGAITTTLNASFLAGLSAISANTYIDARVTVNGLKTTALLPKQLATAPGAISGLIPLYVSSNTYLTIGNKTINPTFTAKTDQRIPYFNSSTVLSDTARLFFNAGKFNIGKVDSPAKSEIITSANNDDTDSKTLSSIQVGFPYIETPVSMAYYGLHIKTDASPLLGTDGGADVDTVRGLFVDLTDLAQRATLLNGTVVVGKNVAGAFLGGFGVGTSNVTANYSMTDLVHIRPITDNATISVFRIQDKTNKDALFVRNNGTVGVGTSNPTARLQIQTIDTTDLLHIESATSTLWSLDDTGNVGIFTNTPAHRLHLVQPSGRSDRILHVKGTGAGADFVMASNGWIGIHTTQPSSNLHIVADDAVEPALSIVNANRAIIVTGNLVHFGRPLLDPTYTDAYIAQKQASIFSVTGQLRTGVTSNATAFTSNTNSTQNVGFGAIYRNRISKIDSADGFVTTTRNFRFQHDETPVMTFLDRNIGIGTTSPAGLLHVNTPALTVAPFVIRKSGSPIFYVSAAGNVGIGTENPAYTLDVSGNVTVNGTIDITTLRVATLNPIQHVQINKVFGDDYVFSDNELLLDINATHTKDLSAASRFNGMAITLKSTQSYDADEVLGVNVDFSDIQFQHENQTTSSGNAYTATFVGGDVVMIPSINSTITTGNRLFVDIRNRAHVTQNVVFEYEDGPSLNLTAETDVNGNIYYSFYTPHTPSPNNRLYFSQTRRLISTDRSGNTVTVSPVVLNQPEFIPDITSEALVVGHAGPQSGLRIGALQELPIAEQTSDQLSLTFSQRLGRKLWFSGVSKAFLSPVSPAPDSDNLHHFWLARSNRRPKNAALLLGMHTPNETEIRVPKTRVVIGPNLSSSNTTVSKSVFISTIASATLSGSELDPIYNKVNYAAIRTGVGIGVSQPFATLHVKRNVSGPDSSTANYVALIENADSSPGNTNSDGLAIHLPAAASGVDNSYMTFMGAASPSFDDMQIKELSTPTVYGSIVGFDGTSVQFVSPGADYSEYIEKRFPEEPIEKGDIVGIINGKVTRTTTGASHVMAISASPIIVGNFNALADRSALVAFLGQVPIKVVGPVSAGDYLIPSGFNDGLAKAVTAADITPSQLHHIVGRAWESSASANVKLIQTVIGFQFQQQVITNRLERLAELRRQVASLSEENDAIQRLYDSRLNNLSEKLTKAASLVK